MGGNTRVVVVGGGTAGITVAARLLRKDAALDVVIIEPSEKHWYQPLWTLVGGGVLELGDTVRDEKDQIPDGATWIKDRVSGIDPESCELTLESGETQGYDFLVMCPGIQLNFGAIPGLKETLGKNGVSSNYRHDLAPYTWEVIRDFKKGGRALFTQPATPVKCGGAPQKIMYLAADSFRRRGLLDASEVHFMSPGLVVFGVPEFERTLKKVIARYGIDFHLQHELIRVDGPGHRATFRVTDADGSLREKEVEFALLHAVPPQSAPDFVRTSPLANDEGWVDLDPSTLQHVRYPNVFGLGDAGSTPNAKTGAAVRKQAPVVVDNLMQVIRDGEISTPSVYTGYSSCPLITGYGKLVLAEFDYENRPMPSFPFDTTKERLSMYLMKRYLLPPMYWHGMLKGRA